MVHGFFYTLGEGVKAVVMRQFIAGDMHAVGVTLPDAPHAPMGVNTFLGDLLGDT